MVKKAVIILANGFEEIEAIAVIDILRRAGIGLDVAGLGSREINSARNLKIITDKTLDEINPGEYDACILPGGSKGAQNLSSSKKTSEIIKSMNERSKLVCAICASPAVVLAPAGILENKNATCYPGMQHAFPKSARYKDDKVVVDGNIITSQGVATATDFALAIVKKLAGKEIVSKLRKDMLFN